MVVDEGFCPRHVISSAPAFVSKNVYGMTCLPFCASFQTAMTEGEAKRHDDVAGARAEAERFRVRVGCTIDKKARTLCSRQVV